MAFVVASYYIGPMNRYDGSGNTDLADIKLFADKGHAINYIINSIRKNIDDDNNGRNVEDQVILSEDDVTKVTKKLNKHRFYNEDDMYMYTLEFTEIN